MKNVFAILSIVAIFNFGSPMTLLAQDATAKTEQVSATDSATAVTDSTKTEETQASAAAEEGGMHKGLKQ